MPDQRSESSRELHGRPPTFQEYQDAVRAYLQALPKAIRDRLLTITVPWHEDPQATDVTYLIRGEGKNAAVELIGFSWAGSKRVEEQWGQDPFDGRRELRARILALLVQGQRERLAMAQRQSSGSELVK